MALSATLVSVSACANSASDAASTKVIETILGGDLCRGEARTLSDFAGSRLFINDLKLGCARWPKALPGFVVSSGWLHFPNVSRPIVIHRAVNFAANSGARRRKIVLRVIGGPNGDISPSRYDDLFAQLLGGADLMVTLGYTGTRHATRYPDPDFGEAVTEIARYSARLRQLNRDAEIILIGESLGGAIAAAALSPKSGGVADKLVLVAPLLWTAEQADRNFSHDYAKDSKGWAIRVGAQDNKRTGEPIEVYSIDRFTRFFENSEKRITLAQRLKDAGPPPTLIVYGSKDAVIGLTEIPALREIKPIRFVMIESLPHIIERPQVDRVRRAIAAFFGESTGG